MVSSEAAVREVASLVVPPVGRVLVSDDRNAPVQLLDPRDRRVEEVAVYLADLQGAGRATSTLRSYAMDLLRWYRFLWALELPWDRVDRPEARDFCRWLAVVPGAGGTSTGLAAATRVHAESVVRGFYEVHRELGSGPVLNPFPVQRGPARPRAGQVLDRKTTGQVGRYRPKVPRRTPRSLTDDAFNLLFAALGNDRDRALVAFYVSTGARASGLLGATESDVDPGSQTIWVVRKGTRVRQELPASPDAFVWLRLYQQQLHQRAPAGRRQPLWRSLRAPYGPLSYHGAHRMFRRVAARVGVDATLHVLRHTAAFRMAQDPQVPLCDVQWVLGHASLSTTQIYTTARPEEAIAAMLAHHHRRPQRPTPPPPAPGYRPESLQMLFGRSRA